MMRDLKRSFFGESTRLTSAITGIVLSTIVFALCIGLSSPAAGASETTLLSADFNTDTNSFTYLDDAFGTTQPDYASGVRVGSGGYGGSGGLQVTLGGIDNNTISGMSGGWSHTFNLGTAQSGVVLSFRYKLDQTATYEFDEYTRMLIKVDGVQYGRGAKDYIDHIGGDGSSSQGNSSSYSPTTDWQQAEIYLGDLAAGDHTIVLGGYNNKKNVSDESSAVTIDDVVITGGSAAPSLTAAQTLADRVSIDQFLSSIQGLAQFNDRCRLSGCASTDYYNALGWVETQLQAMGYSTVRHNYDYNGNTGTNLYATKIGSVTPTEMYMVSAHLDGRGGGDGFDDDGSGSALVLEVARALSGSDVTTDKSVRFIFWDKEEVGLYGARGYASSDTANGGRRALQGTLDEPTWLGIITHDMILYDHGAGSRTTQQSAYADLDVEWRAGTAKAAESRELALKWHYVNGTYAPDYPATAYNYSTNTDDTAFHPYVASISVRENRRSLTSYGNAEWINPYYHQTSDVESSYMRDDDGDGKRDDIELGYNAVRTTLGLVAELSGAQIVGANTPPVAENDAATTDEDASVTIAVLDNDSDADGDTLSVLSVGTPAHGTAVNNGNSVTYTPDPSYNGPDLFVYTVSDGRGGSGTGNVAITVNAVNGAPVAEDDTVTTDEDVPVTIPVLDNDNDVEGDTLSITSVSKPANGATVNNGNSVTYTPDANYAGSGTLAYADNTFRGSNAPGYASGSLEPTRGYDGSGASVYLGGLDNVVVNGMSGGWHGSFSSGSVQGAILSFRYNLSIDAEYESDEYGQALVSLDGGLVGTSGNDYVAQLVGDGNGGSDQTTGWQQFTVNLGTLSAGSHELVIGAYNNKKTYNNEWTEVLIDNVSVVAGTPATTLFAVNFDGGADSFSYTISDGKGGTDSAIVDVTVNPVNDAPVSDAQAVNTNQDTPIDINLTGSDVEGDPLTYAVVSGPSHGSLSGTAPNLTYTPDAGYGEQDSFTFVANDGALDSLPATVNIIVTPVNATPVADPQSVVTSENTAIGVILTGSDADGDSLTYSIVTQPGHGSLSGTVPNLTYTPATDYSGPDSFTFKVNDGTVDSAPATVSITVMLVNEPPVANAQSVITDEDSPTLIALAGTDADSDSLTYTVVSEPSHGSLSGAAPSLTYTPDADYNGADSFTFVVNDGTVDSALATVNIMVTPMNDPPVAHAQSVVTSENTAIGVILTGSDMDGDSLLFTVVTQPVHGGLSGTVPNLTYTPDADYNGSDSFTFKVNDDTVESASAMVIITVTPVNEAPVANGQAVTTEEDSLAAIALSGSDGDGDSLTYVVVNGPSHGSLSGTAPNLTYTPDVDYNGSDSFAFVVNDGTVGSASATVNITVTSVNDPPVSDTQSVVTSENTSIGVVLTGSDVDGDSLTYAVETGPDHGVLSGTAPDLTYTPDADYSGPDSFTFEINDGKLGSDPATVSITVNPSGPVVVFEDDFETDKGWVRNPAGADSATTGMWERANPQGTSYSGTKQRDDTVSGSFDLVTGPLAGSSAGNYDIDGGATSIRSPNIELPSGKDLTLSLSYYLAHASNSSITDYLRVSVVGAGTLTILEELGAANDDDAVWASFSGSLNAYAGQTVYLLIEAADSGGGSLVEAAVDDVSIVANSPATPILEATFDGGVENFSYADDLFRGTSQPGYASGSHIASGGYSGGALQVYLGDSDNNTIVGMSGGWQTTITLLEAKQVNVTFRYKLDQSSEYETDEYSQVLLAVNGILYGTPPNDYVAQIAGDGNGGSILTTGWAVFDVNVGTLPPGTHTLMLGGYNNKKTYNNEWSEILIDDLLLNVATAVTAAAESGEYVPTEGSTRIYLPLVGGYTNTAGAAETNGRMED